VLREIDHSLSPGASTLFNLGQIKDFSSIATLAQTQGTAIFDVVGGAEYLKDEARVAFKKLAEKIVSRTGQMS
jgi:hypothetical protein